MQFLIYGAGTAVQGIVPYILIPIYTHNLGPEGYGIISITDIVRNTIVGVYTFVLSGIIIRYYHHLQQGEREELFGGLWIITLFQMIAMILVFVLWGKQIFTLFFNNIEYEPYGQYALYSAVIIIISSVIPINIFRAEENSFYFVSFNIIIAVMKFVLIYYFVATRQEGVIGVLKAVLIQSLLFAPIGLFFQAKNTKIAFPWKKLREALVFGLPLIPTMLASMVLNYSDRAILAHYVSIEELGIYSFGYQFGMLINLLAGVVYSVWVPYFMSHIKSSNDKNSLSWFSTYISSAFCFSGVVIVLFSNPIISVLAPSSFQSAEKFVPWVVVGYVALGIGIFPRTILMYEEQTRHIGYGMTLAVLVNIVLNFLLIPKFGAIAAAINTFIAFFISLLFVLFLSATQSKYLSFQYLPLFFVSIICLLVYLTGSTVELYNPFTDGVLKVIITVIGGILSIIILENYRFRDKCRLNC